MHLPKNVNVILLIIFLGFRSANFSDQSKVGKPKFPRRTLQQFLVLSLQRKVCRTIVLEQFFDGIIAYLLLRKAHPIASPSAETLC